MMIYIETESNLPYVNLAFEEYFLKQKDLGDDVFLLWQNEPSIVVGSFQNIIEEINRGYVESHAIPVLRRISGGGAVYHDLGNLCFSFILGDIVPELVNASRFAIPLVKALAQLGVHAEFGKRNDLTIDGKKFSGNAMALHKGRLLYHGTLLFDSNLEVLRQVLRVPPGKIESKAVKSVKSPVTNLKPYLPADMDILQFKQTLKEILGGGHSVEYVPNAVDHAAIQALVDQKYCTWEWTYGRNPRSKIEYDCQYSGGRLTVSLEVEKGFLKTCQFRVDSSELPGMEAVAQRLTDVRYHYAEINNALETLDIRPYFGAITKAEVVQCIMGL